MLYSWGAAAPTVASPLCSRVYEAEWGGVNNKNHKPRKGRNFFGKHKARIADIELNLVLLLLQDSDMDLQEKNIEISCVEAREIGTVPQ